jgi:hypothetical protein
MVEEDGVQVREHSIISDLLLESSKKRKVESLITEIKKASIECTGAFASLVSELTEAAPALRIQVPPEWYEGTPLEEKAHSVLEKYASLEENGEGKIPSFFRQYHSRKIHRYCISLTYLYGRLFEILPSNSETAQLLFEEALYQTTLPRNLLMR